MLLAIVINLTAMNPSHFFDNSDYNPRLKSFANDLRKNMTKAEACLWKYALKEKKLRGYQFRRQRPVLQYIADFMCKELNLIIEVDGFSHHLEKTIIKDRKKQKDLEKAGFYVMRFSDDEVLKDIRNVILTLENWIDNKVLPLPPPEGDILPLPPPEGDILPLPPPEGDILPCPPDCMGTGSPAGDNRTIRITWQWDGTPP
jgi:very-short-patch-repair endonuclease